MKLQGVKKAIKYAKDTLRLEIVVDSLIRKGKELNSKSSEKNGGEVHMMKVKSEYKFSGNHNSQNNNKSSINNPFLS